MKRAAIMTAVVYGAWFAICIVITVLKIGDGGTGAHLALLFTGPPASLLSLWLPHGSLLGVLVAGVLGLAQWTVAAELASRWQSGNSVDHGA